MDEDLTDSTPEGGRATRHRVRQGDYLVLYAVDDDRRAVTIVTAHRARVYR